MFATKQYLKINITSVHEGIKPFKCNSCGASFARKSQLKNHIVSIQKKTPFKCNTCDSSFASKGSLIVHNSSNHGGEKPFICNTCDDKFILKVSLDKHIASFHEGIKPFQVPFQQEESWINTFHQFMKESEPSSATFVIKTKLEKTHFICSWWNSNVTLFMLANWLSVNEVYKSFKI